MKSTGLIATILIAGAALANPTANIGQKKSLTRDGARAVIAAAVEQPTKNKTTGDGGNLMALERIDGTFGAGANISIGKARTAALFNIPTRAFEEIIDRAEPRWLHLTTSRRCKAAFLSWWTTSAESG